jgi:hypothetical protein
MPDGARFGSVALTGWSNYTPILEADPPNGDIKLQVPAGTQDFSAVPRAYIDGLLRESFEDLCRSVTGHDDCVDFEHLTCCRTTLAKIAAMLGSGPGGSILPRLAAARELGGQIITDSRTGLGEDVGLLTRWDTLSLTHGRVTVKVGD